MKQTSGRGLARAATLIGLGNVSSRVFGMLREMALLSLFGASGLVSAYTVASFVPMMLYDMIIGGMISSALVPVFSEYAERGRDELGRLAGAVLSLTLLSMGGLAGLLFIAAPYVVALIGGGLPPDLQAVATDLVRVMAAATVFLGLSGVLTGLLYAMQRFTRPAFVIVVFNAVLVVAIVGSGGADITWAAIGLTLGALAQVLLQLPGLADLPIRWRLDLRHPALRRILTLYLPMLLGIAVAQVGAIIDRRLASGVSEQALAWMRAATTLQQFPHGLVASAVGMAALPTLARQASDPAAFHRTLGVALRIVLAFIVPLGLALFILAEPTVALLFERRAFTPTDTAQTAAALRLYLLGVPFVAIDLPLVYAFYARGATLLPNLVAIVSVVTYLAVALPLVGRWGFLGLVAANAASLAAHALVMLWLAHRQFGVVRGQALGLTLLKTGLAGAALAAVTLGALALLDRLALGGVIGTLLTVGLAGGLGLVTYGAVALALRLAEVETVTRLVLTRLRRS